MSNTNQSSDRMFFEVIQSEIASLRREIQEFKKTSSTPIRETLLTSRLNSRPIEIIDRNIIHLIDVMYKKLNSIKKSNLSDDDKIAQLKELLIEIKSIKIDALRNSALQMKIQLLVDEINNEIILHEI